MGKISGIKKTDNSENDNKELENENKEESKVS